MKEVQLPTSPISSQYVHSYLVMIFTTIRWTMTTSAVFGQLWAELMADVMRL